VLVLEKHLRLGDGLAGDLAVLRGADLAELAAVGVGALEEPELELLAQDLRTASSIRLIGISFVATRSISVVWKSW
jgi:hypothetical protein